ncbi:MAG: hypothetical protein QM756_02970 [Polyangiaceae bacterium]
MKWHLWLWLGALCLGCHEGKPTPGAGSNSNWLISCDMDSDCGSSTSCRCGGCTRACSSDADCSSLGGAHCAMASEASLQSQCRGDTGQGGLCLPRCDAGSCEAGQACVLGACVLLPLPTNDFCASITPPGDTERTREDELLDAVEQMRLTGGIVCGNASATLPGSALRLDPRLTCAARVFAADLQATRGQSLTDSQGRSSTQRMSAAGYSTSSWAEGFAFGEATGTAALNVILSDESACSGLTQARLIDVGVAHVGDVDVVTLGAP